LDFELVKSFLDNLPDVFQNKGELYLVEGSMESSSEQIATTNWYIRYYGPILNWISYIFLSVYYIIQRSEANKDSGLSKLVSFSLIFYAFANIASLLPQGSRFYGVGNMLVLFLMAYSPFVIQESSFTSIIRKASIPFLLITIIVNVRRGLDYLGISAILGNPVIVLFYRDDVPLIDWIKQIF
jgi:hypothetical protein